MDNDLERSVRFLEDALSTPAKGIFKLKPRSTAKHETSSNFTISLGPNDMRDLLEVESGRFHATMASILGDERSVTGSVIQGGLPLKDTLNNLCTEFAEILSGSSGGQEILEVAEDMARCCTDALAVIKTLKSKVTVEQLEEEKLLENEKNNWRLLFVLYHDRLHSSEEDFGVYVGDSEKNCISELFRRENLIRESQLVIDWLERNALERNDPILEEADWTSGWENTLHQLVAPDSIAIGSTVDIIHNVHPDAKHFQGKSLHHLDESNEKKLCQRIFMEIRCGKLEKAQEFCYNMGHHWRAAMLEGWKLYHNPNLEETEMEVDEPDYKDVEGNGNRDLWKTTALDFCSKHELNMYEKAAIATLCGSLETILPVCHTWEDYLWAYMRTMVDIRVESEIRDSIIRNYNPLPESYWDQKLSLSEIFHILETCNNSKVTSEAKEIDHIIQKHIILEEIPQLIAQLSEWCEEANVTTQMLRFFAHLVIFFDSIGESMDRKTCGKIIESYINRLSEMDETRLVAFYVSKLSKRKQVTLYAKHCEKILQTEERENALKYAENHSLDVFSITKQIVESITERPSEDTLTNLQHKLTECDQLKINSLDWLLFYEEQRLVAMTQTNKLIFKFLTLDKLDAAQLAINKIPLDAVEKIRDEGDAAADDVIKNYLSFKAYLDAQEAFNDWFSQFKNKPTPPADLPETAQFTEKVAHKHKVSQFQAETGRWKLTTSHSAKTAKTMLYNVLLFPEGWLSDQGDADFLREKCIPEVVLLLYSILSESELHEEAVQLADLIAAEKCGLYKVYSKEKLGEILEKICESSVALLNAKKDPFGNPTSA